MQFHSVSTFLIAAIIELCAPYSWLALFVFAVELSIGGGFYTNFFLYTNLAHGCFLCHSTALVIAKAISCNVPVSIEGVGEQFVRLFRTHFSVNGIFVGI